MTPPMPNPGAAPDLRGVAATYARAIVEAIRQEYPNSLRHTMTGPDDRPTPRQVHPAFYGCFDWHSCVEMSWALVRLLRLAPAELDRDSATRTLDDHLTPAAIARESDYLHSHRGFERPYGWGWALMLADELQQMRNDEPLAVPWATALRPLADTINNLMLAWLSSATYPNREGAHANTAFALGRSLPWARRRSREGDGRLLAAITGAANRWYAADSDYPAGWEPSGADFLSATLAEAELMRAVLPSAEFTAWLDRFLPRLSSGEPRSLFRPAIVSDESDGQIAHLHGLNLHRAFAMLRLAAALPSSDPRAQLLRGSAQDHGEASLPAVTGGHYMVEHWLACYAVLYLGEVGH